MRPMTVINNATTRLSIFCYYNIQEDILHAGADGQKFGSQTRAPRKRYSQNTSGPAKACPRSVQECQSYGHQCLHRGQWHALSFDLLMNNSTGDSPDILSTDTRRGKTCELCPARSVRLSVRPSIPRSAGTSMAPVQHHRRQNQQVHISLCKSRSTRSASWPLGHHPADCRLCPRQDQSKLRWCVNYPLQAQPPVTGVH